MNLSIASRFVNFSLMYWPILINYFSLLADNQEILWGSWCATVSVDFFYKEYLAYEI